jgi:hypothetical protein
LPSCCRKYSTIGYQNTKQQKIIQPKPQVKFAANREIRRTRGAGKKKEVTVNAPSKKMKAPTPVSREKPKRKGNIGGGVGKKRQKLVVLTTAASSRPRRNKGRNTYLNEDALVPPIDVDSDQSHYSRSESGYRSSDVTTESKSSEEEGQAIKSLATDAGATN